MKPVPQLILAAIFLAGIYFNAQYFATGSIDFLRYVSLFAIIAGVVPYLHFSYFGLHSLFGRK